MRLGYKYIIVIPRNNFIPVGFRINVEENFVRILSVHDQVIESNPCKVIFKIDQLAVIVKQA